jgi:hypothetical protein
MQPKTLFLAGLALANTATADRVFTTWSCLWHAGSCSGTGDWVNDSGAHYAINANDGCRDIDVPGINQVCFDWKGNRAHFYADGQAKRCLVKGAQIYNGDCRDTRYQCITQWWEEVKPCYW